MKWIRWQGLVAFAVIIGGGLLIWVLVIDSVIEKGIEMAGTKAVGAKVELKSADLSLSPLGLTLEGLEVTDPDEPMTNVFEVTRLAFLMDAPLLLIKKVSINEMSAEGIRLATARKTSGAIEKKQKKAATETPTDAGKTAPPPEAGKGAPDINKLIESQGLTTLKLAEKVEDDIKAKEAHWDKRLKTLPGSSDVKGFERRYKEIERKFNGSTTDKLMAAKEAGDLRKDIKAARNKISSAKKDFKADYKNLKASVDRARKAPKEDIKRLKEQFSSSGGMLEGASDLVFGAKAEEYLAKARAIYARLEPFIESAREGAAEKEPKPERGKGIDVKFKEDRPAPDLRIRTIKADVTASGGTVEGNIWEITSDQRLTGLPTSFEFKSDALKDTDSLSITGSMDHRKPTSPDDRIRIDIMGRKLDNATISDSSDLPVSVKSALTDMQIAAMLGVGGRFDARASIKLREASFVSAPSPDAGDIMEVVGRTISSLSSLELQAKAVGSLDNYSLSLSSDLDDALKAAMGKMVAEEAAKFEARLTEEVNARTREKLSQLSGSLGGMDSRLSALTGSDSSLDSILKDSAKIKPGKLFKF